MLERKLAYRNGGFDPEAAASRSAGQETAPEVDGDGPPTHWPTDESHTPVPRPSNGRDLHLSKIVVTSTGGLTSTNSAWRCVLGSR